jgi:hypothetical protein
MLGRNDMVMPLSVVLFSLSQLPRSVQVSAEATSPSLPLARVMQNDLALDDVSE